MKIVVPRLTKLGVALFCAASAPVLLGQAISISAKSPAAVTNSAAKLSRTNSALRPGPRETIEFSGPATAPALPKPKSRVEDLEGRFGGPNGLGNAGAEIVPEFGGVIRPAPSRAQVEKAFREWDKKKNWLAAGTQEDDSTDPSKALQNDEEEMDDESLGLSRPETVMEKFINRSDNKPTRQPGRNRSRNSDSKNEDDQDGNRERREENPEDRDKSDRELRERKRDDEPNGLATFNLGAYLNPGSQRTAFGDMSGSDSERWRHSLRDIGASPKHDERTQKQIREREEARSAEFQQLLRPRATGSGSTTVGIGGLNDPVNLKADLTKREINPILPRGIESSGPSGPMFGAAPPPRDSFRTENVPSFGITPSAGASFAPTVSAPPAGPSPVQKIGPLVHEPPKRLF